MSKRILIIEDDDLVVSFVSRLLESNGHVVAKGPNGKDLVYRNRSFGQPDHISGVIKDFKPDIILLDHGLVWEEGFNDGDDILKYLRSQPWWDGKIRIIGISAVPQEYLDEQVLKKHIAQDLISTIG